MKNQKQPGLELRRLFFEDICCSTSTGITARDLEAGCLVIGLWIGDHGWDAGQVVVKVQASTGRIAISDCNESGEKFRRDRNLRDQRYRDAGVVTVLQALGIVWLTSIRNPSLLLSEESTQRNPDPHLMKFNHNPGMWTLLIFATCRRPIR